MAEALPEWKNGPDDSDWDLRRRQLYDAVSRDHYVDVRPDLQYGGVRYALTVRGSIQAINLALARGIPIDNLTPERKLALVVYGES